MLAIRAEVQGGWVAGWHGMGRHCAVGGLPAWRAMGRAWHGRRLSAASRHGFQGRAPLRYACPGMTKVEKRAANHQPWRLAADSPNFVILGQAQRSGARPEDPFRDIADECQPRDARDTGRSARWMGCGWHGMGRALPLDGCGWHGMGRHCTIGGAGGMARRGSSLARLGACPLRHGMGSRVALRFAALALE